MESHRVSSRVEMEDKERINKKELRYCQPFRGETWNTDKGMFFEELSVVNDLQPAETGFKDGYK